MLRTFIVGLIVLLAILFSTSTGYSYLLNNYYSPSIETIKEQMNNIYGKEHIDCIIEATYFEARGETIEGHKAIVEVIKNRTKISRFPNTFCGVVNQDMQFSYRNGDKKYNLKYNDKLKKAEITNTVYSHLYNIDKGRKTVLPDCASHYDGKSFKKPSWSKKMKMVEEIGNHQFYCYPDSMA